MGGWVEVLAGENYERKENYMESRDYLSCMNGHMQCSILCSRLPFTEQIMDSSWTAAHLEDDAN